MVLPWEHEVRLYTEDSDGTPTGEITATCTCGGYSHTYPDGMQLRTVWELAEAHTAEHPPEPDTAALLSKRQEG